MVHGDGLCDDILIDIFLRLSVEPVFRFKCISKRWKRILSTPSFRSKYHSKHYETDQTSSIQPVLGFFQASTFRREDIRDQTAPILSFLAAGLPPCFKLAHNCFNKLGFFVAFSNGVLLCGHHPTTYYVCNPFTGRWIELPKPTDETCSEMSVAVGFLYEEKEDTVADCFRGSCTVVRANLRTNQIQQHYTLPIETYSSETGAWEESVLKGSDPFRIIPRWPANVINGIYYWFGYEEIIVAYDPNFSRDRLWLIELPDSIGIHNLILAEDSASGLLLCGMDDYPGCKILCLDKKVHSYSFTEKVSEYEWTPWFQLGYSTYLGLSKYPILMDDPQLEEYPRLIAFHPQNWRFLLIRIGQILYWCEVDSAWTYSIPFDGNLLSMDFEFHLFPCFFSSYPWSPNLPFQ